ncbi:PepSY-associated TM helix domain-containing protein [Methylocapsa acidiphila]|uniref:PepSY-associated TM helix domain-containing protein n=1 Tax=Methylocapsa acidiphila TaxID=133552 RepID=UPI000478F0D5|nr:PepSY-associated TM helix domain-containing protein [Methylocapsa acidiphila]
MDPLASPNRRSLWRRIHLWIGLGAGALIVPICFSGVLLVFGEDIDRLLDPARYAVSGPAIGQGIDVYLANAELAAPGGRAATLRWPATSGAPIIVFLRSGEGEKRTASGASLRMAYLDPPTGRALGVVDARASFIGRAHSLHGDLMLPNLSGRQIVGFIGVGLLTLAVTGLKLWWPASRRFLQALWWRRGAKVSVNLHYVLGGWIALPLGLMALTGAYLGFPQQGRALIAAFSELSPRPMRQGPAAALLRRPILDPDRVVALALQTGSSLRPTALVSPTEQDGLWRVQLSDAEDALRVVTVDDATSAVKVEPPPTRGDGVAVWLRQIHEASHHGPIWRAIGVLCGLAPAIFLVTGVMMWLRRRSARRSAGRLRASGRPFPAAPASRRKRAEFSFFCVSDVVRSRAHTLKSQ